MLYGLESCMLLKADRVRLDSFQAKCLRKIFKIAPAFLSRVSNADVRAAAEACPLSSCLLQRQLNFYGKLARGPPGSLPRAMVSQAGQDHRILPRDWGTPRLRGRPRLQWNAYMHAQALAVAGNDPDILQALLRGTPGQWNAAVVDYCFS